MISKIEAWIGVCQKVNMNFIPHPMRKNLFYLISKLQNIYFCFIPVPGNSLTETLEDICMGKKDNTDSAQVVTGATLADLAALGFGHQLAWLLDCEASLGFHSGTTSLVACAALSVVGILG